MNPMSSPAGGMTLPQVISLIDRRLIHLESTTKALSERQVVEQEDGENDVAPEHATKMLADIEGRFEVLADEIANIKNIVLNLQSYTMDVNRMLLEGRSVLMPSDEMKLAGGTEYDASGEAIASLDDATSLPTTAVSLNAASMMMAPEEESDEEYQAPITKVRWSSSA